MSNATGLTRLHYADPHTIVEVGAELETNVNEASIYVGVDSMGVSATLKLTPSQAASVRDALTQRLIEIEAGEVFNHDR